MSISVYLPFWASVCKNEIIRMEGYGNTGFAYISIFQTLFDGKMWTVMGEGWEETDRRSSHGQTLD